MIVQISEQIKTGKKKIHVQKTIRPISVSVFNDTSVRNKSTATIKYINITVKHSYNK